MEQSRGNKTEGSEAVGSLAVTKPLTNWLLKYQSKNFWHGWFRHKNFYELEARSLGLPNTKKTS